MQVGAEPDGLLVVRERQRGQLIQGKVVHFGRVVAGVLHAQQFLHLEAHYQDVAVERSV